MNNIILEKYAKQHNMLVKNNYMYGVIDGYYISVQLIRTGYVSIPEINIPLVNVDPEDKRKIKFFVKENKKALKLASVEFRENIVAIKVSTQINSKKDVFTNSLNGIIEFYKENGYISGCSVTKETENIKFTFYKGTIVAVSQDVAVGFEEKSKQMDVDNENKGYLSGVIGACIGGLIGILPWVLFALVGYVSAISGLAMGWLVKTGYDKANGKKGGAQLTILIIALIVFTYMGIIGAQTVLFIQMLSAEGYDVAEISIVKVFNLLFTLPFSSEPGASEMCGAIVEGYFFAALGCVYFFIKAKRNKEFTEGEQINTTIEQPNSSTAA